MQFMGNTAIQVKVTEIVKDELGMMNVIEGSGSHASLAAPQSHKCLIELVYVARVSALAPNFLSWSMTEH